jgi:hypothetical protein
VPEGEGQASPGLLLLLLLLVVVVVLLLLLLLVVGEGQTRRPEAGQSAAGRCWAEARVGGGR